MSRQSAREESAQASAKTTVLFADDEQMLLELLRTFLAGHGISIVGETGNGKDAVTLAGKLKPTVAVLDIVLPVLNGIEAAAEIHKLYPEIGIVMFTAHIEADRVARSLQSGALGFVWKGAALTELVAAIHTVSRGRPFISPIVSINVPGDLADHASRSVSSLAKLTPRQRQVLQLVAEESANKDIATTLSVSVKTVEKHRADLMQSLDIHSVAGLVRFAVRAGLVD